MSNEKNLPAKFSAVELYRDAEPLPDPPDLLKAWRDKPTRSLYRFLKKVVPFCAVCSRKEGKPVKVENIELEHETNIVKMSPDKMIHLLVRCHGQSEIMEFPYNAAINPNLDYSGAWAFGEPLGIEQQRRIGAR